MISHLKGTVAEKGSGWVIVEVGGIGFHVSVPAPLVHRIGEPGSPVTLRTHLDVREDGFELFGFADRDELEVFKALLSVSRVGPRMAIKVLTAMTPAQIVRAVVDRDLETLRKVPGLGEETASRLVVDMARKVKKLSLGGQSRGASPVGTELRRKAGQALKNLGYTKDEIEESLKWASAGLTETPSLEDLLKRALAFFREEQA
jgi:Holliday junction DNA helicase RuvA